MEEVGRSKVEGEEVAAEEVVVEEFAAEEVVLEEAVMEAVEVKEFEARTRNEGGRSVGNPALKRFVKAKCNAFV